MEKFSFSKLLNLLLLVVIVILILRLRPASIPTDVGIEKSNVEDPAAPLALPNCHFTRISDSIYQLPSPMVEGGLTLAEALHKRRSQRDYLNKPLSAGQVSQVLWAAYGITQPRETPPFLRGGLRTAPSAGARYPLEVFLLAGQVEGLPAGLYRYIAQEHRLQLVAGEDLRAELCEAAYGQEMVEEAPAVLLYTAIFDRCTSKYGERGRERYVCMDLGHSAQNVYLQVQSLGLGTCAIGAFDDEQVKKVAGLPLKEEPLYLMPFGYCVE